MLLPSLKVAKGCAESVFTIVLDVWLQVRHIPGQPRPLLCFNDFHCMIPTNSGLLVDCLIIANEPVERRREAGEAAAL